MQKTGDSKKRKEYFAQLVDFSNLPDTVDLIRYGCKMGLLIPWAFCNRGKAPSEDRFWVSAVNNWGRLGKWAFHVCKDPQELRHELAFLARNEES